MQFHPSRTSVKPPRSELKENAAGGPGRDRLGDFQGGWELLTDKKSAARWARIGDGMDWGNRLCLKRWQE
jgi:hypothetical protein